MNTECSSCLTIGLRYTFPNCELLLSTITNDSQQAEHRKLWGWVLLLQSRNMVSPWGKMSCGAPIKPSVPLILCNVYNCSIFSLVSNPAIVVHTYTLCIRWLVRVNWGPAAISIRVLETGLPSHMSSILFKNKSHSFFLSALPFLRNTMISWKIHHTEQMVLLSSAVNITVPHSILQENKSYTASQRIIESTLQDYLH